MRNILCLFILALAACSEGTPPKPPATPPPAEKPAPPVTPDASPPAKPPAPALPTTPAPAALLDPTHPDVTGIAPQEFRVKFSTSKGDFTVLAFRPWSPRGADRFYNLVKAGFYDECRFFRVLTDFMAQVGINGDPRVSKAWKNTNIMDDPAQQTNARGMISFATSGPNTRTTQIFINFKDNTRLDGMGFSPFAKVIEGMDVVDKLHAGYGEGAPQGKGPEQGRIEAEGNAYLQRDFPELDYIKSARLVP